MASWSGKSKGGKAGYQFFIFLLKNTNIKLTYFFIKVVSFFYLMFSDKKSILFYFNQIHGYGILKSYFSIYKNYCMLGEVLIDKIAMLSGVKLKFSFDFEGEGHLRKMVHDKKGGLLIGAHMGNWEMAGQLLERLETRVNIVMYEAEHQKIKELLDKEMNKSAHIIPIKEDYSHLFKIREAFKNNEIVAMHGDRFLPGTNTVTINFMGREAQFPTGPLYLASKDAVPVSFVFTLKESSKHYHFYATPPKVYDYPSKIKTRKSDLRNMVKDYVSSLEHMLRKYPLQWFNYYPFWN